MSLPLHRAESLSQFRMNNKAATAAAAAATTTQSDSSSDASPITPQEGASSSSTSAPVRHGGGRHASIADIRRGELKREKDPHLSANLSHQDNVIARLDGLGRLMTDNNTMLSALMRRLIKNAVAGNANGGGAAADAAAAATAASPSKKMSFVPDSTTGKSLARFKQLRDSSGGPAASPTTTTTAAGGGAAAADGISPTSFSASRTRIRHSLGSPAAAAGPTEGGNWSRAKRALLSKVREQQLRGDDGAAVAATASEIIDMSMSPLRGSRPPSLRQAQPESPISGSERKASSTTTTTRRREGAVVSIMEEEEQQQHHQEEEEEENPAISVIQATAVFPPPLSHDSEDRHDDSSSGGGASSSFDAASSGPKQRQVIRTVTHHHHHHDASADEDDGCCGLSTYTIDPESWLGFFLDVVFILGGFGLVLLVITFLLLPDRDNSLSFSAAVAVAAVCQFFTLVWMASRFMMQSRGRADQSPFSEHNPELEWDIVDTPIAIRAKYLNFWFFFDLLYALPIEFIFVFHQDWFFYVMTRHLLRFFRIGTVGRSANPLQESTQQTGMVMASYGCIVLLILHFIATLFVRFETEYAESHRDELEMIARVTGIPVANNSLSHKYSTAIYWSVASLTSVGYGDIRIYSQSTRVLAMLACCVGICVVATAAAVATRALTQKDILEEEMSRSKKMMHSMLTHFSIPKMLQKEIILLFPAVLKAQSEGSFRDMIRVLPGFLSDQVEAYLRAKMLAKVPLFSDLGNQSEQILLKLSRSLEQVFAAPYEMIIRAGEVGGEMFLLVHGVTEVLLPINEEEEVPVATLRSGSYFGEIALIESSVRSASVQAVTACDLLVLGQEEFVEVVGQHPELQERVRLEIAKRRKELAQKQKQSQQETDNLRRKSSIGRSVLRHRDEEEDDEDYDGGGEYENEEGVLDEDGSTPPASATSKSSSPKKKDNGRDVSPAWNNTFRMMHKKKEEEQQQQQQQQPSPPLSQSPPSVSTPASSSSPISSSSRSNNIPARKPLHRPAGAPAESEHHPPMPTVRLSDADDIFEEELIVDSPTSPMNPLRGAAAGAAAGGAGGANMIGLGVSGDIPIMLSRPVSPADSHQSGEHDRATPPPAAFAFPAPSGGINRGNSFRARSGSFRINPDGGGGAPPQQQPPQQQQSALGLLSGGAGAGRMGANFGGFEQVRSRGVSPMPNQRPLSPYRKEGGSGFG